MEGVDGSFQRYCFSVEEFLRVGSWGPYRESSSLVIFTTDCHSFALIISLVWHVFVNEIKVYKTWISNSLLCNEPKIKRIQDGTFTPTLATTSSLLCLEAAYRNTRPIAGRLGSRPGLRFALDWIVSGYHSLSWLPRPASDSQTAWRHW